MTEHNLPDKDDAPWLNLTEEEIEELRKNKQELTEYGKKKIRELMNHEEMLEEAARREAENKALASLGIDYEDFKGEDDVDYEAPNGDYIKSYSDVTRVEVIGPNGREYVRYECSNVQVSLQDDGQTIKVFIFSTYD